VEVAVAVMAGVLAGLHAAHETTDESGVPLGIIHRDMSPQNIMVGLDGIPRLLDFGIAKARSSAHVTRAGMIKGKFAYMAPEQVAGHVSRRSDVYACGVVLWELLSQRKPHTGKTEVELLSAVVHEPIPSLTSVLEGGRANMAPARWEKIARVDAVVARAVDRTPENRFASAAQMLDALLHVCPAAAPATVTAWVQANGGEYLERGKQLLAATDGSARSVSGIALTGHPAGHRSGVTRIGSEPSTSMHWDLVSSSMVSSNAELLAAANRGRLAPWLIAGGSLLVTGILIGTLLIHRGAPAAPAFSATTGPPPKADAIAQVVQAPSPTVLAPTTSPVAKSVSEAPEARAPVAVRPIRYPAQTSAPAPRRAPSAPTMSGAETAEPMASPMAPSTPGPKTDCDPPFYFEGSKKVFKRGCI
jgi:serine/threonine-protein kinase